MFAATMERRTEHTAARINSWLLPILALSLPLSTSAVTVVALAIAAAWLVEGKFGDKMLAIGRNSVCVAVLLYLALYTVGMGWSEDWSAGLAMLEKQWKFLLLPVFMTVVRPEHRHRNIYFYLAGLTAAMLLTYLAWFDLYHYGGVTPEHPTRKVFHVVYNPMLAFGFYLVMHEILWGRLRGRWRPAGIGLALAMAWNMFITEGRAGQLAFFAMLFLLLVQYYRKNLVKGLLGVSIILPLIFTAGYMLSPTFHNRVDLARQEVAEYRINPNTSVGLRLLFWQNSWQIIKENPLFGVGTGDFKKAYAEVNAVASPDMVATDNPHNQYVLMLCQFGIVGLGVLLGMFMTQIRLAFMLDDDVGRMRMAFPLLFLVIMLTESYLLVYETGFLFSLFGAILYTTDMRGQQQLDGR